MRLNRWAKARVLARAAQELWVELEADTQSLDSTIIHLQVHGAGARRKGGTRRLGARAAA